MKQQQYQQGLCWSSWVVLGLAGLAYAQMKSTVYQPDETIFACPDQGFYLYRDLHTLESDVGKHRAQGLTLVWGRIDLEPYREQTDLPPAFLAQLEEGFAIARDQGMKVIVRASYGHQGPGGDYRTYEDPSEAMIRNHIQQLAPVFGDNADIISLFEAGFVGPWGEWHGTAIARDYDRGRDMLMYLLAHTPRDRMIVVRYPYLKQQLFARCDSGFLTVTADTAYSGLPVARIGHHNDCFLSSNDDVGTYDRGGGNRSQETAYLAAETLHTVFGGETCRLYAYNDCGRAVQELARLHGTYLNNAYQPKVLQKWHDQGCFDQIKRRLGARLQLIDSCVSSSVLPGECMRIEFSLTNIGFASLYNGRSVQVVLEQASGQHRVYHTLGVDPRLWKPGQIYRLHDALILSEDMPAGSYTVHLYLPDAYPSLADDPRYALRLANKDVWQADTGFNKLASGIQIGTASRQR